MSINRIVLDTNCLIAILSRKGNYFPVWQGLHQGKYILCVSNDILKEYEEIRDALDAGRFHAYKEEKLYNMGQINREKEALGK